MRPGMIRLLTRSSLPDPRPSPRVNGKIGGGRYKLSPHDQRESIRLIQVEKKSQGQVAHIYKVDRSTISRMMAEVRLKQDLKGGVL
jgi:hypothetical protein